MYVRNLILRLETNYDRVENYSHTIDDKINIHLNN